MTEKVATVEPIRRNQADEKLDYEETLKNIADGVYEGWPNEAGVSSSSEPYERSVDMYLTRPRSV
jgi:hypothetical protein